MKNQQPLTILKSIVACLLLVVCWFVGVGISQFIAFPPALLGLLVLFFCLLCLGRVPKSLARISQFFLPHLSLFFISPLVVAWLYAEHLGDKLYWVLLVIVLSTLLSMVVTAWLAQRLLAAPKADPSKNPQGKG